MSTIDELINKERSGSKFVQNGSFKVRATEWVDGKLYFIPYYRSMCSWNGLSDSGISRRHPIDRDDFEIYVEPKPKRSFWHNDDGLVKFRVGSPGGGWLKIEDDK